MTLYVPKAGAPENLGRSKTLIIGTPGVGKTQLASTWPFPFFMDIEGGAGSTGCPRVEIPTGPNMMQVIKSEISKLKAMKFDHGAIMHPAGFKVETIVVDSIDAIQVSEKTFGILKGKLRMERSDWDALFNLVQPVMLTLNELPVHIIFTGHVKQEDKETGPGIKGLAIQGAMKDNFPRWFDYILHVVSGEDGKRTVITQPMINRGYNYLAKDRHKTFTSLATNGPTIPLPEVEGRPSIIIADKIRERHHLNGKE